MDKKKIVEQIIFIRDTGITNMFDVITVKELAEVFDFAELVEFINKNKTSYCNFILTGKFK